MVEGAPPGRTSRLIVRLVGFKPVTSQEAKVTALQRLYPRHSREEIARALGRLPLILTRSATEEQARKIQRFLESKGAILEIFYAPTETARAPEPQKASPTGPAPSTQPASEELKSKIATEPSHEEIERPHIREERRAKPRVDRGMELHPMGVGEILDRSFRLLRERFWLFLAIMLIPVGLIAAGILIFSLFFGGLGLLTATAGAGMNAVAAIELVLFLVLAVVFVVLVQIWAQGAFIVSVSETYLGHQTSVSAAYKAMLPRLLRLALTYLLVGASLSMVIFALVILVSVVPSGIKLVVGILSTITILLAVFAALFILLLLDKVVVLEDLWGWTAVRRSWHLMRASQGERFWSRPRVKAVLIILVVFLIAVAILLLFQVPQVLMGVLLPANMIAITFSQALSMVGNSLTTAFGAMAFVLFYYDIRLRKEGFDLKMMAENL